MDEGSKKLIKEIIKSFHHSKENHGIPLHLFHLDFMKRILTYFAERQEGYTVEEIMIGPFGSAPAPAYGGGGEFIYGVFPMISAFKRTDAEADALVMVLFEEILKLISQPIYARMETRGLLSPNIDIFGRNQ